MVRRRKCQAEFLAPILTYTPKNMTKVKYNNFRTQVQKVEEKILAITGDNVEYNMEWTRSQRKCEQVERLIWKRKHLLDKMFVSTPEEVVRMEQVNNRLYDLTQKMYSRTEALCRKVMTTTPNRMMMWRLRERSNSRRMDIVLSCQ